MNITTLIQDSENKFKKNLEDFFLKIWGNTILLSHGIGHHRRVWHYSKEILCAVHDSGIKTSPDLAVKLIIASYLHDIGMSVDPGEQHGYFSGELCRIFITENQLDEPEFKDVIYAVAVHDQKEYNSSSGEKSLLSILSVADDLDAFGYIGIYRYLEIYLARGIPASEAAFRIKLNAEKRYSNFLNFSSDIKGLKEMHKERYQILLRFFKDFINTLELPRKNLEMIGYQGISEMISEILKNKDREKELITYFGRDHNDLIINDFTSGYLKEIKEFPG